MQVFEAVKQEDRSPGERNTAIQEIDSVVRRSEQEERGQLQQ